MADIKAYTKTRLEYLMQEQAAADDVETKLNDAGAINGLTATVSELNILDGVTATAAELNLLDESNTEPADGAFACVERVAKAEYDFDTDGGSQGAIDLGVDIPDNAVITKAVVDVITTLEDGATDTATGAISVQGADDIVAAIAINDASDPWDAGLQDTVPDPQDAATLVKTTAAKAVTFTIGTADLTAGKFNVYIWYVISE